MSQREGIATFLWAVAPFVLGYLNVFTISGAVRHPIAYSVLSTALLLGGFGLFVTAKITQYRKGLLWSFGSSGMSVRERWFYRLGYALMIFGGVSWMGTIVGRIISRQ